MKTTEVKVYVLVRKDLTQENHEEEICIFTNEDLAKVGRNLFSDEFGGEYNYFFIRHEIDRLQNLEK